MLAPLVGGWAAWRDGVMVAYVLGLSRPTAINLLDVAFAPGEKHALAALIETIHTEQPEAPAQFVNLAAEDPAWPVLSKLGYMETMAQSEMWLTL